MSFDSVVFLWDGNGPRMAKAGKSGEIRMIVPGKPSYKVIFVNEMGRAGTPIPKPFLEGFGNVNFQGITRGGREMDNVLKSKAETKQNLKDAGDTMVVVGAGTAYSSAFMRPSSAQLGVAGAGLAITLGGLVVDAVSNSVNAEADTRNWRTLPHTLKFYCLKNDQQQEIRLRMPGQNQSDFVKTFPPKNAEGPVKFYHSGTQTERWELVVREPIKKIETPVPVKPVPVKVVPAKQLVVQPKSVPVEFSPEVPANENSVPADNANTAAVALAGTWKSRIIEYRTASEVLINGQWRPAHSDLGKTIITYHFHENGQFEAGIDSISKSNGVQPKMTLAGTWIRNGNDLRLQYNPQDVADQHFVLRAIDEKTLELREADINECAELERTHTLQNYQKSKLRVEDYRLSATIDGNGTVTRRSLTKMPNATTRVKTQTTVNIIERQ